MSAPYAESWKGLLALGYSPIPVEGKYPPLKGCTGWRGRSVDALEGARLAASHGTWNVALRLPDDAVGVDVDAYNGGLGTLADLEAELGTLSPTIMSTARDDGSGIRLFRKPRGWHLAGKLGDGIEVVQHHHRYVMAAPSMHPKLETPYRWVDTASGDEVDLWHVGDLPDLSWSFLERFRKYKGAGADAVTSDRALAFIAEQIDETFPAALKGICARLVDTAGGRHDALVEAACWSLREAAAGLYSAEDAIATLLDWWTRVIADDQTRLDSDEFGSAILWAIGQVDADPERVEKITQAGARFGRLDSSPMTGGSESEPVGSSTPRLPAAFWNERPVLAHIRQAAHARMIAPDAVLGSVLARIVASTSHRLGIPAIVGHVAGLELFVAIVAPAGHGKGSAGDAAADLVPQLLSDPQELLERNIGSGEGGVAAFFSMVLEKDAKGNEHKVQRQTHHNALFRIDEAETLARLAKRQDQTTMSTLRSAWSWEALGVSYADATKNRLMPAHSYRIAVVMGVQPSLARFLFDDAGAGTPQRFSWFTGLDPDLPDDPPDWPGPLDWRPPSVDPLHCELEIAADIRDEIRAAHRAQVRGHIPGDELGAHGNLRRLKVAAALAVLDGRLDVNADDWRLAGIIEATSNAVRDHARRHIALEDHERSEREARRAGRNREAQLSAEDDHADRILEQSARTIARRCARDGGPVSRRDLVKAVPGRNRSDYGQAGLDLAADRGWIVPDGDGRWIPGAQPEEHR